ncbi:MAG: lipoyl(octanoyl) transferase LipB, partial [Proteobacteria bacterium]|nr:lipoyl(octanoyl) transferase LipB [Pseudomonadota bacterium]
MKQQRPASLVWQVKENRPKPIFSGFEESRIRAIYETARKSLLSRSGFNRLYSGLRPATKDSRGQKKGLLDQDVFLILEHAPVFTLGLRGGKDHLKVPEAFLASRNIPLVHIERGGDITYHGPGQLVVYPIVNLKTGRWRVISFVEILEELMLLIARDWGIQAERRPLNRGIWVGQNKLGSVGIAVRRSVSFHGLALNVNTDLEPFQWIDPCGLTGVAVTSLQQLKHREIPLSTVRERARTHIRTLFNKDLEMI